jgi:predicted ester cyclase
MSLAEKKQIARNFIEELLNKGNLENVDTFVTPDFIYHNVAENLNGVENFRKCAESDHITFHDIQYSFVDSIAEDGKVAIVCIVEARHVKEFRGIAATHKKVETVVVIIFHFQGNKIKEAWAVADGLTAAFQLGVVKTSFSKSS